MYLEDEGREWTVVEKQLQKSRKVDILMKCNVK